MYVKAYTSQKFICFFLWRKLLELEAMSACNSMFMFVVPTEKRDLTH